MAIIGINLSDTIGTWVTQFDNLGLNVGDLTLLTTNRDSNLVAAINSLDSDIGALQGLSTDSSTIINLFTTNFEADSATIVYLDVSDMDADSAKIITLLSTTINVDNLNGDSATFSGDINAANFNSTSDIKFKENIESLVNSISTLNQIRPVSFNWIGGNKSYGVIAQELEQIVPELVNEDKYGIKRVSYTPIIALLIDAIKAHEVEIQKLKNCQCNCK